MFLADRLILDAPKRTATGMKVRARAARTGTYDYAGFEVDPENKHGLRDKAKVTIYRPGDEVFDRASLASFIGKPLTNDHPTEPVTEANWRDHARGTVMGAVRDGEYVAFDLMVSDAEAIAAIEGGKRELSNGYATDLKFEPGTAPDGTAYDAVQTSIRGNHIALVDRGRAGPECRIADRFAACDSNPAAVAAFTTKEDRVKVNNLDGMSVNLSDATAVEQTIATLDTKLTAALDSVKEAQTAHDKELAAKDAEIDKLKANQMDQAQIDALADAKAETVAKAKAVLGDKMFETAGKSVADIRRAACDAKGIETKDKSDDYVEARFDALTADSNEVQNIVPATPKDAASTEAKALSDSIENLNAWRTAKTAAA